jgi:hypothetical protein
MVRNQVLPRLGSHHLLGLTDRRSEVGLVENFDGRRSLDTYHCRTQTPSMIRFAAALRTTVAVAWYAACICVY